MSNDITFRKYQIEAIARVFKLTGVEPAGPDDEQVVAYCRSHRTRQNSDDGRLSATLAERSSDDDLAPF